MAVKRLGGVHLAGYRLSSAYQQLLITRSARVGGYGVIAGANATIGNFGTISGGQSLTGSYGAAGIDLQAGGVVSNWSALAAGQGAAGGYGFGDGFTPAGTGGDGLLAKAPARALNGGVIKAGGGGGGGAIDGGGELGAAGASGGAGVYFAVSVNHLTNLAGGLIEGGAGGGGGAGLAAGGAGGSGGAGVGGLSLSLANGGTILGGEGGVGGSAGDYFAAAGAGGAGGVGVDIGPVGLGVAVNHGTIEGGQGGAGGRAEVLKGGGGAGGAGVVLQGAGRFANVGTVLGGVGAAGDGLGGDGVDLLGGASITNGGLIAAGAGGVGLAGGDYGEQGGAGGVGLDLIAGGDLIDAGSVIGGAGGDGGAGYWYAGPGGAGGAGVILGQGAQVIVIGAVRGGGGGDGGYGVTTMGGAGGAGGDGLVLRAGALTIEASGTVAGGAGGVGGGGAYGQGASGAGGAGVELLAATRLVNAGAIIGGGGGAGLESVASATIINRGSIDAGDGRGNGVNLTAGGRLVNELHASIGGWLGVYAGPGGVATLVNDGTIGGVGGVAVRLLSAGDRLELGAEAVFIGAVSGAGGALELTGGRDKISGLGDVAELSGTASMTFSGFDLLVLDAGAAALLGGTNRLDPGQGIIDRGDLTLRGTFDNAGQVDVAAGASLALGGHVSGPGRIVLGAVVPTTITLLPGGVTLAGGGQVSLGGAGRNSVIGAQSGTTLTNADTLSGAGALGDGRMRLLNTDLGVIDADSGSGLILDTGAMTIINLGTIEATGAGACVIQSAMFNNGHLLAAGEKLVCEAAVSGAGTVAISGGAAEFLSTFDEAVDFLAGSTGELVLGQSSGFHRVISGFSTSGASILDLRDIGFVSAGEARFQGSATQGVLIVSDGTHTARIHLAGDYHSASFTASADGQGGVLISALATPSAAAFCSAMAAAAPTLAEGPATPATTGLAMGASPLFAPHT